jgi:DNA end-binding protein Ku
MERAIWKGTIGFGLVQIPVGLYSAEAEEKLSFHQLDKRDLSPIGYERINKTTGKPVEWDDIVKGYEYEDGRYVVLGDADFKAANVEATQSIDITDVVDARDIPPMYFERPYYIAPTKAGRKAYALLREVLSRAERVGIAKVVIRTRQHLAAVVPMDSALALVLLRFEDELRDPSRLELPDTKLKALGVTPKELEMAEKLVEGMVSEWDPSKYRDDYREDLLALIEKKAKSGKLDEIKEPSDDKRASRQSAKVIDLMSLLKKSVEGSRKSKGKPHKARASHRAHKKSA